MKVCHHLLRFGSFLKELSNLVLNDCDVGNLSSTLVLDTIKISISLLKVQSCTKICRQIHKIKPKKFFLWTALQLIFCDFFTEKRQNLAYIHSVVIII